MPRPQPGGGGRNKKEKGSIDKGVSDKGCQWFGGKHIQNECVCESYKIENNAFFLGKYANEPDACLEMERKVSKVEHDPQTGIDDWLGVA